MDSCTGAIQAIIGNCSVICAELEKIARESYGEPSRISCGLLPIIDRFSVYFGLKLSYLIFIASEQVSRDLQR